MEYDHAGNFQHDNFLVFESNGIKRRGIECKAKQQGQAENYTQINISGILLIQTKFEL